MNICLYGAARDSIAEVYIKSTYTLGSELARRGHTMVFGGGTTGMMGAAARGVREAGGRIIGVAPHFFHNPGILVEDWGELFFTDTMRQRKQKMEDLSDGFIIVPGGIGTLDEFFEIFTLRSLGRHEKPIAIYNVNGYFDELITFLKKAEKESFLGPELWDCAGIFSDMDSLFSYLERLS